MADLRIHAADDPPSMLVLILNLNLQPPFKPQTQLPLTNLLEQTLVFLNAFHLLHPQNRIAIILHDPYGTTLIHPNPAENSIDPKEDHDFDGLDSGTAADTNPSDITPILKTRVTEEIKKSLARQLEEGVPLKPSGIAAALSMALCLLNRRRLLLLRKMNAGKDHNNNTKSVGSGDLEMADIGSGGGGNCGQGRVLVMFGDQDRPSQYVPIMNCIFSAQRIGVLIDTCMVNCFEKDSTYFQQAAKLTNGLYLKPGLHALREPGAFIQYLLTVFLPDTKSREFLAMPTPEQVDFRASCFKTKKVIDQGLTCSVCLSTFDAKLPTRPAFCPVCDVRFALPSRLRARRKA